MFHINLYIALSSVLRDPTVREGATEYPAPKNSVIVAIVTGVAAAVVALTTILGTESYSSCLFSVSVMSVRLCLRRIYENTKLSLRKKSILA